MTEPEPKDVLLGGCAEAAEKLGLPPSCCGSCHEDEEMGYPAFSELVTADGYYNVCCGVRVAHDNKVKP